LKTSYSPPDLWKLSALPFAQFIQDAALWPINQLKMIEFFLYEVTERWRLE